MGCEKAGAPAGRLSLVALVALAARQLVVIIVVGVVLCILCSSPVAHDNSRSRSLLVVQPGQLSHFIKLQTRSVWEVLPLDPDGNLLVEPGELQAIQDELVRYVTDHVRVRADGDEALQGAMVAVELVSDDSDALFFEQWIELELRYELAQVPRELEIEVSLFLDTSPRHQDLCDVLWADGPDVPAAQPVRLRFWAGDPRQLASSGRLLPPPGVLAALWGGALELLMAPLALLCLAALLAGWAGQATRVIGAFSVSLAVSVAGAEVLAGQLNPVAVTLASGLAVAWVGVLNLVTGDRLRHDQLGPSDSGQRPGRPVWAEALVFGLLLGFGLAAHEPPESPTWLLAAGAAAASLLVGWAMAILLHRSAVAGLARLLTSLAAIVFGGWTAWSALAPC